MVEQALHDTLSQTNIRVYPSGDLSECKAVLQIKGPGLILSSRLALRWLSTPSAMRRPATIHRLETGTGPGGLPRPILNRP